MRDKNVIKISVRNLIEFVLRYGDLVSTFTGTSRNVDAIKVHQKIQNSAPKEYKKEVALSYTVESDDITLEIGGRADGIIEKEDKVIIDEIKTTTRPLELIEEDYNRLHWAQAKCYAFIYAKENNLENVYVQLTYYQMDTKEIKRFIKSFEFKELEDFFYDVVKEYVEWAKTTQEWRSIRNDSINKLKFPFEIYREGQRKLAVSVYKTIEEGKMFFAQAPTGIGKTIATLFPTIKAMGQGHTSKIFYLTAKTITRTAAEKAIENMRINDLKIKNVTITAKDKVCFNKESSCDPEKCDFAKGHFDRINDAIKDIFNEDEFPRGIIEKYALKHRVCPFEFSLELANFADCIICDYNYVFDPRVYLRNFFQEGSTDFTFLIDEAHNLVDRGREMFSAKLSKKEILELKKDSSKIAKEVSKSLNKINSHMVNIRKVIAENNNEYRTKEPPNDLIPLLREFTVKAEKWILENKEYKEDFKDKLIDIYFKVLDFVRTYEGYDERYVTYGEKIKDEVKLKIFCQDPSYLLQEAMKRGKSAILFSATLTPMDYFIELLGGDENSYRVKLGSPFENNNLCLLLDSRISTTYKMREFSYDSIVQDIEEVVQGREGNYLVFFPSYKYMEEVYTRFSSKSPHINTILQNPYMSEEEREEFLGKFSKDNEENLVGFAVLGGIFSEGIDLVGDRLIGTIIVGVGLPQICLERNIIRDYFSSKNNKGFEYAYMYPGINKVMQAAGRVIRTEVDKGIILLIDKRFSYSNYLPLITQKWGDIGIIKNYKDIILKLRSFWETDTRG